MAQQPFVLHPLLNILLVAMTGGLITFIVQSLLRHRDRLSTVGEAIKKQLQDHEDRVRLIELKLGFLWKGVEEEMSHILKRPTHLEMDALLDKLRDHTITLDECYTLRRWLEQVYLGADVPMPSHRVIAVLVLGAVNSLILELEKDQQYRSVDLPPLSLPAQTWWQRIVAWWRSLWNPR